MGIPIDWTEIPLWEKLCYYGEGKEKFYPFIKYWLSHLWYRTTNGSIEFMGDVGIHPSRIRSVVRLFGG